MLTTSIFLFLFFFFKQKTAYEITRWLEFRRVLFRSQTIAEARRLWKAVGRENLMVKIPGTPEGLPAIEQMISEGININVTLLFAQEAYERVAQAYLRGLERFAAAGGDLSRVASVARFFVSRIDALIDSLATTKLKTATDPAEHAALEGIIGKVAIANAR